MELLYKAPNIEISYDPESKIMFIVWIGPQDEKILKLSGETILELFKEKGCSKILNDNSRVVGSWYQSGEWTSEEWFPRMFEAGLTRFAWVFSMDIFAELSARRAMPKDSKGLKVFASFELANDWLSFE